MIVTNKPTPAPWHVHETGEYTIEVCAPWGEANKPSLSSGYGSSLGIHVAQLDHQGDNECVSKEVAMLNAHLISAAPEMLEALENLENDDSSIPAHAWQMVQDAIKKARGEA